MARMPKSWRLAAGLLLAVVFLASGCVTPSTSMFRGSAPEEERPCKIYSYWDQNVRIAFNTESKRVPPEELPFLAGRVYFFGPDGRSPLTPRGTLIVDFYDTQVPPDAEPPLLGRTVYGPQDLQKVRSENLLGMGYTILAYWGTYSPKYTRVRVQVTFIPEKGGGQIFAEPALVSLQGATVKMAGRVDFPGLHSTPTGPGTFTAPAPTPLGR
jgi:hypothetical protein